MCKVYFVCAYLESYVRKRIGQAENEAEAVSQALVNKEQSTGMHHHHHHNT